MSISKVVSACVVFAGYIVLINRCLRYQEANQSLKKAIAKQTVELQDVRKNLNDTNKDAL